MTKREWWQIGLIYIVWLILLTTVTMLSNYLLPFRPSFPYSELLYIYDLPEFLTKLAHFDGVHYLRISNHGYLGTGLIQAFFPLYPALIFLIDKIINNNLLSAIILSHILAALSFFSFYYLVRMDFNKKIALTSLLIFAFFSTSFFLRSVYGESLFLSLIFLSLISAKKGNYLLAGIFGALASATRVIGIFIWPSLLILVWLKNSKNYFGYILVSLSVLGLIAYMYYLQITFGDALYFFRLQEEFGASRQTQLIILPQVVYRYLKIFWTVKLFDLKYYSYIHEFLLTMLSLFVLIIATWKSYLSKNKSFLVYLLFAWQAFLLPPLTGNFSSMPRYLLACFPLFIYLAQYFTKRKLALIFYLTSSLILLIINLLLFSQGYWVA